MERAEPTPNRPMPQVAIRKKRRVVPPAEREMSRFSSKTASHDTVLGATEICCCCLCYHFNMLIQYLYRFCFYLTAIYRQQWE